MLAKSSKDNQPPGSRQSQESESGHPVIRTLYDHFEVNIYYDEHQSQTCLYFCIHQSSFAAIIYNSLVENKKPKCIICQIELANFVSCFIGYEKLIL